MNNKIEVLKEFEFSDFISLLKSKKKFIILFTLIFTALVIGYSLIMPQKFTAVTTLMPPKSSEGKGGLSSFLQSFAGGGGISLGSMGKSNESLVFSEIITSKSVAKQLIDTLDLKNDPDFEFPNDTDRETAVRNLFEVELAKSGIIDVVVTVSTGYFPGDEDISKAKRLSAQIANLSINSLDNIVRDKNVSSARNTRIYIENEATKYRTKLDSVEKALEKFQKENKVLSIDEQTVAILNQVVSIGAELSEAEIKLGIAQQEFSEDYPLVRGHQSAVDYLREQYKKAQTGGILENDQFSFSLAEAPELIREYTTLKRDQKILERVLMYLETQKHEESIQEQKDVPLIEVLDPAEEPVRRSSPNRKLMLMLSLVMGFGLSIITVFTMKAVKN